MSGGGVAYLVHFPGGHQAVYRVRVPYVVSLGTPLLPGWIVERVEPNEARFTEDVPFALWLAEDSRDFVLHGVELAGDVVEVPPGETT
jgi:hypothetical protein